MSLQEFRAPSGRIIKYSPDAFRDSGVSPFYVNPSRFDITEEDVEEFDLLGDVSGELMRGFASAGRGLGWLAKKAGMDPEGVIENLGREAVDWWEYGQSDEWKESLAKSIVQRDEEGNWEWGEADLGDLAAQGVASLPSFVVSMGAGGGATKVLQGLYALTKVFGNPLGRGALLDTIAAGTKSGATTRQVNAAIQAERRLKVVDDILGATGFSAGIGAYSGGQTAVGVQDMIMGMPHERLAADSDRYREILGTTDDLMTDEEAQAYARETLAMEAASEAGLRSGIAVGLLSGPLGAFYGGLNRAAQAAARGSMGRIPRAIGEKATQSLAPAASRMQALRRGAALEGVQEFGQSGAESYFTLSAFNEYAGQDMDVIGETINGAITGMLIGAPLGGGFAALSYRQPSVRANDPELPSNLGFKRVRTEISERMDDLIFQNTSSDILSQHIEALSDRADEGSPALQQRLEKMQAELERRKADPKFQPDDERVEQIFRAFDTIRERENGQATKLETMAMFDLLSRTGETPRESRGLEQELNDQNPDPLASRIQELANDLTPDQLNFVRTMDPITSTGNIQALRQLPPEKSYMAFRVDKQRWVNENGGWAGAGEALAGHVGRIVSETGHQAYHIGDGTFVVPATSKRAIKKVRRALDNIQPIVLSNRMVSMKVDPEIRVSRAAASQQGEPWSNAVAQLDDQPVEATKEVQGVDGQPIPAPAGVTVAENDAQGTAGAVSTPSVGGQSVEVEAVPEQAIPEMEGREVAPDGDLDALLDPEPISQSADTETVQALIDEAGRQADTHPDNPRNVSQSDLEAGNYRKGRVAFQHGVNVSIENPVGSVRRGRDRSGEQWSIEMVNPYGFIEGTQAADGEGVDVYLGGQPHNPMRPVFIVNQYRDDGSFDEHKVMMGFRTIDEAESAYQAHSVAPYEIVQTDGFFGFKSWLLDADKTAPAEGDVLAGERPQQVERGMEESPAPDSEGDGARAEGAETGQPRETQRAEEVRPESDQTSDADGYLPQIERTQGPVARIIMDTTDSRIPVTDQPLSAVVAALKEKRPIGVPVRLMNQLGVRMTLYSKVGQTDKERKASREAVERIMSDVYRAGVPLRMIRNLQYVAVFDSDGTGLTDGAAAFFWPGHGMLGISRDVIEAITKGESPEFAQRVAASYVAHEMAHAIDFGDVFTAVSHESADWNITPFSDGYVFGPHIEELIDAFENNTEGLQEFLGYPFNALGAAFEDGAQGLSENAIKTIQSEAFAQAFALYLMSPGKLQRAAPTVHQVMEEVVNAYGQIDTAWIESGEEAAIDAGDQARERLRQAIRAPSPDSGDADGRVGGQGEEGAGDRAAGSGMERVPQPAMERDGRGDGEGEPGRPQLARDDPPRLRTSVAADGKLTVTGPIDQIRKVVPDDIKGTKVPNGIRFATSDAARVEAAISGRSMQYGRSGRVLTYLPKQAGKYVGAPKKFNTPNTIRTLRKRLRQYALEGEPGRFWYENSSQAILRMVQGDVQDAKRFAALLSIYSPQAGVPANGTFALRAWAQYRAGQPISVKTKAQDRKAEQAMADIDGFWSGEKTGNFFNNLLRNIDPSTEGNQGATIDLWMMRAAEYENDAPTAAQYAFMENETNRLALEFGWEPQQVQAAIWVSMKARSENAQVKKKTEEVSEKKGWIEFRRDRNGKRQRIIKDAAKHRQNWIDHARKMELGQDDIAASKFDFADSIQRHVGQLSLEARPGRTTGVLPGIHDADYEVMSDFQRDAHAALLDEDGNDMLAGKLGLLVDNTVIVPGVWQAEVSPSTQMETAVAVAKGSKSVEPAQASAMNAYAAITGWLFRQEGVGWHRPFYASIKREANGVSIDIGRQLTDAEAVDVNQAIDGWMTDNGREGWEDAFAVVSSPVGVRLISFGAVSNKELQTDILRAIEGVLPDADMFTFRSEGDMPTNDWGRYPDGQDYIQRASAEGRSDVFEWARDVLAPRVQEVFERYSEQYGWGDPGSIVAGPQLARFSGGARTTPAPRSRGRAGALDEAAPEKKPGEVDATGVHFSSQERGSLDGRFFGQGMRGDEWSRIESASDARIKSRVYAYLDSGSGIRPESGVGSVPHRVHASNLYDASADPLGIGSEVGGDSNAFESSILDYGFDGILYREAMDGMGAMVILGEASHNVVAESILETDNVSSMPAAQESLGRNIARRIRDLEGVPVGSVTGDRWASILEGADPDLFEKIQATGALDSLDPDARYYKSDIAARVLRTEREQARQQFRFSRSDGRGGLSQRALADDTIISDQTQTPEFKRWFGNSWAADYRGNPLVLYHGTNADFTKFDADMLGKSTRASSAGLGFFFTSKPSVAEGFAALAKRSNWSDDGPTGSENIMPVYLSMQNPMEWSGQGKYPAPPMRDLVYEAKSQGYDGLIVRNASDGTAAPYIAVNGRALDLDHRGGAFDAVSSIADGSTSMDQGLQWLREMLEYERDEMGVDSDPEIVSSLENLVAAYESDPSSVSIEDPNVSDIYVVFSPEQIKSATGNVGTFDPTNPDIRYSVAEAATEKQFMSAAQAEAEILAAGGSHVLTDDGRLEMVAEQDPGRLTRVQSWADSSPLTEGREVTVYASHRDAPERLQRAMGFDPSGENHSALPVEAAYDTQTGEVHVFANMIRSQSHFDRVIAEEIIGHGGLRALFGDDLDAFIDKWNIPRAKLMPIARAYSLDLNTEEGLRIAKEEFVAKVEPGDGSAWDQLVTWLRNALRSIGLDLELSDREAAHMMARAREAVLQGYAPKPGFRGDFLASVKNVVGQGGVVTGDDGKPLVVYHGSMSEDPIISFDESQIGRSSLQAGGRGFYFYEDRRLAEPYARDADGNRGRVGEYVLTMQNPLVISPSEAPGQEASAQEARQFTENAQDSGHDGIIIEHEFSGRELIAFSADQITPADKFRFSVADPAVTEIMDRVVAKASYDQTLGERFAEYRRRITDRFDNWQTEFKQGVLDSGASIEAMERALNGGALAEGVNSPWKAYTLTKNISNVMAAVIKYGVPQRSAEGWFEINPEGRGLVEIFRPLIENSDGNMMRLWEAYSVAVRADRLIDETNPDGSPKEKRMTREEIDRLLELGNEFPVLRQVHQEYQTFNNELLDLAVDVGLIAQESRELWSQNDYVPFYRVFEDAEGPAGPTQTRGSEVRGPGIRRLRGADAQIAPIMENITLNTANLLDKIYKHEAMKRIRDTAIEAGAMEELPPSFRPVQFSNQQLAGALRKSGMLAGRINKDFGEIEDADYLALVEQMSPEERQQYQTLFEMVTPQGDDVAVVIEEGRAKHYRVTDPLLLRTIKGMGAENFGNIMNLMRGFRSTLTQMVTIDPGFMVANWMRDVLSAWTTVPDVDFTPLVDSVRSFSDIWKGGRDSTYAQMMMAGGAGGGFYDVQTSDVGRTMREMTGITVLNTPSKMLAAWRRIGNVSEQSNRIAIANGVLKDGGLISEAAFQAQDVTNFSQHGDWKAVRFLIQTVPFMNARIQGLYKLYRGGRDNPAQFAMRGAMIAAASLALLASNWDEERYEDLEDWQKDIYWHVFVGDQHFAIPKPFEVGVIFGSIPERAMRFMGGRDDLENSTDFVLTTVSQTFSLNPIPQAFKPMIEQWANKSFFTGRSIIPFYQQNLHPEAQYRPWTSDTARLIAEIMPDFFPEVMRSPDRIESLVRGYLGTIGLYVMKGADSISASIMGYPEGPETGVFDLAPVRRFIRTGQERGTRYEQILWDSINEADAAFRTLNAMARQGRVDQVQSIRDRYGSTLSNREALHAVAKAVRDINEASRQVMYSLMDPTEKRRRLDQLQRQKNDLLREAIPRLVD